MKIAYFTICSRNYLAYALTLRASLLAARPAAAFHIYLADDADDLDLPSDVTVIPAADLDMPAIWDMAMRYTVMEFNTAIKPFCILDLWDRRGFDAAVYLDPDILVLKPLTAVEEALTAGADCVLTPHLLEPLDDQFHPDDIQILRTGVYNLGFGAFANAPGARRFVEWWARRCQTDCVVDLESGLFVDQRLADFAPAFCESARILRDPGYNVAYWNIKHRPVRKGPDGWTAAGAPLAFFHFSGVAPGDPAVFSKHQNRFGVGDIGDARDLLTAYLDALDRNGHQSRKARRYAFDWFADGVRITPDMRRLYAGANGSRAGSRDEIFSPRYELFNAPADIAYDSANDFPFTRLMNEIYRGRKDLHEIYPLATPQGRWGFTQWFLSSGSREHDVPEACLAPARQTMARSAGRKKTPIADRATGGVRSRVRGVARVLYRNVPGVRAAFEGLPAHLRMNARRMILNIDAEADAAAARAAPTLAPAHGRLDHSRAPGVDLYGYFRAETGVGEGARRAFFALEAAGVPVNSITIGTRGVFREQVEWRDDNSAPRRIALIHVNADQTPLLGALVDSFRIEGAYRIGYWAWELPVFPPVWAPAFDLVDEIWTPSSFTAAALGEQTRKPVRVVPHPAADVLVEIPDRRRFGLPEERLLFFANLDLNSFVERKNPYGAVRAFKTAFSDAASSPALVLKMHGGRHVQRQRRAILKEIGGSSNIFVIDRVLPRRDLASLQASCDVYLSLHRAEGFGLGIAEFMALGKPVIVTGYSGNMDYTDNESARLVGYDLVPVREGEYPHSANQLWAEPRIGEAIAAMRDVASSPQLRADLGRRAKARVECVLAAPAIAAIMRARLEAIDPELREATQRRIA